MTETPQPDLKERTIHRDLSWIMFNDRVLEEAADPQNPFLERLKFLAICSGNMDEFYMVRVAGLLRVIQAGQNREDRYGYYPQDLYSEITSRTEAFINRLYDIYRSRILKEFPKHKILLKTYDQLNKTQAKFVGRYFEETLFPILTPMAIDQGHPFPVLPSKTIAVAVNIRRGDQPHLAIIPFPQNISRLLKLPSEKDEASFILIDEVLRQNVKRFFRGYELENSTLFRIVRDSELSVDEEDVDDLLKAVESEVKKRTRAKVVYLEVEKSCPDAFLQTLCEILSYPKEQVVRIDSDMDLTYLYQLIADMNNPELLFKDFIPAKIPYENIFDRVNEGDFITHVPFQSFYPTLDLIQSAARDEKVLAIKMTLYRTNKDSAIIRTLKEAAKNKKQVTVLVEIKARFDEEQNITWARELEEAGCHVIYGMANLKIHSKMTLIVRKEEGRIRRYVHLSTGNYNEKTAKGYTDLGYFTANDDFAKDISDVFNVITGYSLPTPWKRIISSPYDLRKYFMDQIEQEISWQKKNKNGMIIAKMNSLEDTQIIEKLYTASQAGVKIRLIVRGICCLVPGVKGLSENIEVKSVVGRFLEHTRIYLFHNNANPRIFLASADWMMRNFDRRIELLFEISRDEIKEHLGELLNIYWKDEVKSRYLEANKTYQRPKEEGKFNAQEQLISHYKG